MGHSGASRGGEGGLFWDAGVRGHVGDVTIGKVDGVLSGALDVVGDHHVPFVFCGQIPVYT